MKPTSKVQVEVVEEQIERERIRADQQKKLKDKNEKIKEIAKDRIKSSLEQIQELAKQRKLEESSEDAWNDERVRKYLRDMEKEEQEAEEQERKRIEQEELDRLAKLEAIQTKRVYGPAKRPAPRNSKEEEAKDKTKYDNWVVPQGQKGDGITDLNKKFGY